MSKITLIIVICCTLHCFVALFKSVSTTHNGFCSNLQVIIFQNFLTSCAQPWWATRELTLNKGFLYIIILESHGVPFLKFILWYDPES